MDGVLPAFPGSSTRKPSQSEKKWKPAKFIIQDIDGTHVFVIAELVNVLQERVGELMDQNAFSLTQK